VLRVRRFAHRVFVDVFEASSGVEVQLTCPTAAVPADLDGAATVRVTACETAPSRRGLRTFTCDAVEVVIAGRGGAAGAAAAAAAAPPPRPPRALCRAWARGSCGRAGCCYRHAYDGPPEAAWAARLRRGARVPVLESTTGRRPAWDISSSPSTSLKSNSLSMILEPLILASRILDGLKKYYWGNSFRKHSSRRYLKKFVSVVGAFSTTATLSPSGRPRSPGPTRTRTRTTARSARTRAATPSSPPGSSRPSAATRWAGVRSWTSPPEKAR